jgi:DNA-binding NarL/FixJ family response regulator
MMRNARIAVIDDDPFVFAHLEQALRARLPGVEVMDIAEPIAPVGFDVYVVDKEFHGTSAGHEVVRRIQAIAPGSLVVAYSAHLDRDFLRTLVGERCEGAFDKGSLEELDRMISLIETYLNADLDRGQRLQGFSSTVRAISNLVREWNLRLAASRNSNSIGSDHA